MLMYSAGGKLSEERVPPIKYISSFARPALCLYHLKRVQSQAARAEAAGKMTRSLSSWLLRL